MNFITLCLSCVLSSCGYSYYYCTNDEGVVDHYCLNTTQHSKDDLKRFQDYYDQQSKQLQSEMNKTIMLQEQ